MPAKIPGPLRYISLGKGTRVHILPLIRFFSLWIRRGPDWIPPTDDFQDNHNQEEAAITEIESMEKFRPARLEVRARHPEGDGSQVHQDDNDLRGCRQAPYTGAGGKARQDIGSAPATEDEGAALVTNCYWSRTRTPTGFPTTPSR